MPAWFRNSPGLYLFALLILLLFVAAPLAYWAFGGFSGPTQQHSLICGRALC